MNHNERIDPLELIASAMPDWSRLPKKNEPKLSLIAGMSVLQDTNLYAWCACSKDQRFKAYRKARRADTSYSGVRSVDFACGSRPEKPSLLIQLKYDKEMQRTNGEGSQESCLNTPRNHALRDTLYLSLELDRMGEGIGCHRSQWSMRTT